MSRTAAAGGDAAGGTMIANPSLAAPRLLHGAGFFGDAAEVGADVAAFVLEAVALGAILPEEGLAIADIDGDGRNEILAGTHWYKFADGRWEQHKYADDYITTLVAVGDIDGDGKPEIVLSEGDACIYGYPQGGKLPS